MPVQRSATEVIAIFTELGLPVCDDWPAIKAKVDIKRARYLRDCSSPEPHASARAKEWFVGVSDLEHSRADLLKTVYQLFHDQARIALDAALASGVKTLTPQLHGSLRDLVRKQCKTDDDLSDKFLAKFYNQYDLTLGKGIGPKPASLTGFTATNGFGQVELKWNLPAADCDEVEVVRDEGAGTRSVYRGRGTSYIDRAVSPGVWYTYRAHVNYRGESGDDSAQRALCLGDVSQAAAEWREGQIQLRWVLPGGTTTSVLIFRREGMQPTIRIDPAGVRPADSSTTKQVHAGSGTSWIDTDLKEGSTYFYRIVTDFGPGMYGQGVEVQATVPRPLPPVAWLTAGYQFENGKDVVHLKWDGVSAGVRYTVIRREGATPPARRDDGVEVLTAGDQTSCRDEPRDASGKRFAYGVFTVSGDRCSRTAAPAGPVSILTEIDGLKSQVGDGVVELEWTPPARTTSVVVRRSLNPPRDHNDGVPVRASSPTSVRDVGLKNGQRYHYLVCCGYRPDGSTEVFSPGLRFAAVPAKPPEPIKPLKWRVNQKQIEFTWDLPPEGEAVLIRSAQPVGLPFGKRLGTAELNNLGTRILPGEPGQRIDPNPDVNAPHYTLVTVAGDQAVIGDTQMVLAIPGVSDLTLSAEKDGALLRWTWPDDCQSVRVSRRADTWPGGPDDPKAVHKTCTLDEYRNNGNKFLDTLQSARGLLHYVVHAQSGTLSGRHFSSGTDPGSRTSVQWESWMTVAYRLMGSDVKDADGLKMLWRFKVETPFPAFKGLVLVANEQRIPNDASDGVVLSRWQRKPDQGPGEWQIKVALKPVQQRGWAQFYCKAFPIDPAQGLTTLMIHPNPCVPVMANGRVDMGKVRPPAQRTRAAAPPGEVICPQCFEKFRPEQILYTDEKGAPPRPAQWSVVDRMMGKPPKRPVDAKGHPLGIKLCPSCKKQLPNTAGALDSLIIGLVGAKYSGKSHYVASLIQRLQAQAGIDLHASMYAVTDETPERYRREFFDPLYKDREELPVTVGSPPPLIYNLQFDGRLYHEEQDRAVTLSLYDTAGENFNQKDVLQRTVKYLSVASGLMFLVDPLQLDSVRDSLQFGPVNLPARADPTEIIRLVLGELEARKVLEGGGKMKIPVAVVLTKADLLRDVGLIPPNRLWCTDKRHVGRFDLQAHLDMSGMVGEFVQRWHPALYSLVTGRFERHSFFAASATGCASDRQKLYKFIAPWRVEDPMVWLLAEMGMVPTR